MGDFTQKMGLATWDQQLDRYDYLQLSNNWQILDFHDHSPGRGVLISRGGIAPGAIGPSQIGTDIPWVPTEGTLAIRPTAGVFGRNFYATDTRQWFVDNGSAWITTHTNNGAVNIPTPQSTSSTTYTTLPTPDQVTGIVLPTNGLIRVWYQATWQESVQNTAKAAIFIGANQLKMAVNPSPIAQEISVFDGANPPAGTASSLSTTTLGLSRISGASAYTGDVTTGQLVGEAGSGGGSCDIFAAAGTYTISVQFKASSGSVTVSNRKLWVQALDFSG